MGYVGVETNGVFGSSPTQAAKLFNDMGLVVSGAHSQLLIGDKKQEIIDLLGALISTGNARDVAAGMSFDYAYQKWGWA